MPRAEMKGNATSRARRVAVERTDALFEQRRIGDIKTIEKATLHQIEEKRTKLRELVGESYKDVIHSADAILEMQSHAASILEDLQRMRGLMQRPEPMQPREIRTEADEQLHILGSRVKYVMDTQEVIWNALDAGDFVEAARRLLKAEKVHEQMQKHSQSDLLHRFPFVQHQWPVLTQLRPQILERMRQSVVGSVEMSEEEVQLGLVALAMLSEPSTKALLQTYLQYRKLSVLNLCTSFASHTSVDETFCQIGRLLQDTVWHVMRLFLGEAQTAVVFCQALGQDTVGFSGLLYGRLGQESEQELWDQQLRSLRDGFENLPISVVANLVEAWLSDVAQIVQDSGRGLLLGCTQLKLLVKLERTVKEVLSRAEWDAAIKQSLGLELDLWKIVFESVIQQKCLDILQEAFQSMAQELAAKLQKLMSQVAARKMEPLARVSQSAWALRAEKLKGVTEASFRTQATEVVEEFDEGLVQILREVSEVLGVREQRLKDGEHSPSASVKPASLRSFSLLSGTQHRGMIPRKTDRSIELEPQIQNLWESTALALAKEMGQKVQNLPKTKTLNVVEAALLIGTVAMGLAENCPSMGLLEGPAEDWRPDAVPRSTRSSIKLDTSAPPHIGKAFRSVTFQGVELWIEWGLEHMVEGWSEAVKFGSLTGEEHLQEIVISHQAAETVDDQMKFSVPSRPSEQTMRLLMDASLELQRLGLYSSQQQILHLFQFQLEAKVRSSLQRTVLGEAAGKLTDYYILQILLDFRFVCDVCSAGAPVPKMDAEPSGDLHRSLSAVPEDAASLHDSGQRLDPAIKRAIAESQNLSKLVEAELSSLLDPIDWATYEPHLWTAEQRSYRRSEILFGTLCTTHRPLHATVAVKLPAGTATNLLQAVPVAARFQYLPVRPTVSTSKGQHSSTHISIVALTEQEDDPSGGYGFSDLGQSTTPSPPPAQKEEVGSFTSLGTMFTDKAAEMSAIAQQRIGQFGDYLQPSTLASSSIFSFAKRVGPTGDPPT